MRLELSEASPDDKPFAAAFTAEHLSIIESRIEKKFDEQLAEAYDKVTKKAEFLLKLAIPKQ